MTTDLPLPIAVVCHDAGGANVVAHWVAARDVEGVCAYVEGPARQIWAETVSVPACSSLKEAMNGAASLVSSTSIASTIEHEARRSAKGADIKSVAMLDHWTRYPDRFVRNGERLLPDELWVGDEHAEAEARRCFPGISVRRVPNYYLDAQVRTIESFGPTPPQTDARRILYVLEPIQRQWSGNDPRTKELQAFDFFMAHLDELGARPDVDIVLRPHPSDPQGIYDGWQALFPDRRVSVSDRSSLAAQIAWADWVVGCETFALVIATHAGRITMSSLPPWAPKCRLPISQLRHLAEQFPTA